MNIHGTFTISGTIINAQKRIPADSSVYVKLLTETGGRYETYCNQEGKYVFTLYDSLNGKHVIIRPDQDDTRIKKDSITGTCSYSCTASDVYLASTERVKLKINTDSVRDYRVDFALITPNIHFYLPSLYLKKNELQLMQSDYSLSTDSAICFIISILQCHKQFKIEIAGNCSPKEKNKNNLSLKRATLVQEKLIAMGVHPKRLFVKGYADKHYHTTKEYYTTYGDSRPAYINKIDYEGQTVTLYVISKDFKE